MIQIYVDEKDLDNIGIDYKEFDIDSDAETILAAYKHVMGDLGSIKVADDGDPNAAMNILAEKLWGYMTMKQFLMSTESMARYEEYSTKITILLDKQHAKNQADANYRRHNKQNAAGRIESARPVLGWSRH